MLVDIVAVGCLPLDREADTSLTIVDIFRPLPFSIFLKDLYFLSLFSTIPTRFTMAARLRIPTLALAALSIGLNVAILGCAGRTLNVFMMERYTSTWFMPVWSSHFDTRELWGLIGTSAAVLCLNVILVAGLFVASVGTMSRRLGPRY